MAKLDVVTAVEQSPPHHLISTDIQRLHRRNGVYYFRAKVPSDLNALLPLPYTGKREIKISLKTRDKAQALALFSLYGSKIEQLFVSARLGLLTGVQAQPHFHPTQFPVQPSLAPVPHSVPTVNFESLIRLRIDQMRIDRRTEKTIQEFQGKMKMLSGLLKDRLGNRFSEDLSAIQYDDIAAVLSRLQDYQHKGRTIGPRTAYAYGVALASLFKFGVEQRYLNHSCMPKLIKPKEMKRSAAGGAAGWRALGESELQKLLGALSAEEENTDTATAQANTSTQGLLTLRTLLGLYSGLRIEEICSLRCGDVQLIDGVPCISVNALYGKHVKSTSSIRIVPLHPSISDQVLSHRDCMLQSYTETVESDQLLWPDLKPYRGKYSATFTKQYGRFLRKYVSQDKMHVFHSLRKNFAQGLQRAGVQRELIGELLGHSDQSVTSLYTGSYDNRAKADAIQLLKFGL